MKLTMRLNERSYDIIVKSGALRRVSQLVNLNRKVLVVTDSGVPKAYAETVLQQCGEGFLAVVPQGEASKSIACFESLSQQLLEHHFGRNDAVVAVGGGVVGDLAGFVAASYMRGIAFINCPTTTLAQVDSSIGGKVAVNLCDTKN
ncbi:MAG: iron-containing alcohol dehydrogenase, partial [Ruthenibacterium sp.]